MRVRTIDGAVAYFKEQDPETALTKTAIRRLVVTGEVPSSRIGTKYLVDLDILEEIFSTGTKPQAAPLPEVVGGIRRIETERKRVGC